MFIVWEEKEQGAKSHIGLKGADGIKAGSSSAGLKSLDSANKESRSPSHGAVLSFANTKLAASVSGCLSNTGCSFTLWLGHVPSESGSGHGVYVRLWELSCCWWVVVGAGDRYLSLLLMSWTFPDRISENGLEMCLDSRGREPQKCDFLHVSLA